jgi:aspartate aminotransferase/aminotransferase
MTNFAISRNIEKIPQALSIFWNQKAADINSKKLIKLALGEAFLKVKKFNLNKYLVDKNYHYTDSRGNILLRKKISELYKKKYASKFNYKEEIIISAGSKILTYMSLLALLNKGEEAVTFEPAWLSYQEQTKIIGCKMRFIPFSTNINSIKKFLKKKTKVFILNNPNNPSGKLYDKNFLLKLYKILKAKNIYLICDEAYSDFIPENKSFISALAMDKKKEITIVVNSLSKNFGMSGWRLGYVIANKKIIEKLLILNQHLITCAPSILQNYVGDNFENLYRNNILQIKKLLKKRKIIEKFLKINNIEYLDSDSTFYFFISINKKINVDHFCNELLYKKFISVVPGRAYGKNTDQYIRISIGTEKLPKIIKALKVIQKLSLEFIK